MQMLVFDIAGTNYAIDLPVVQEILRAVAITPLSKAPPVIAGVVNFRGSAIPVFDMRERVGAPPRELDPDERFVVARTSQRVVALRVDSVDWVRDVPADVVQSIGGLTNASEHVTGVARFSDSLVFIHDLESFLSAAEARDLSESLREWTSQT